jgi:hypothetical protein
MAAFESSHKSLLQGVSQQIATERLPGQVGGQENMLSDVVTNPRRRPGAAYAFDRTSTDATSNNIKAWFTDIAGFRVHVILNTTSGEVVILDEEYTELAVLDGAPYLTTTANKMIQAATVGDEFFILNRDVKPTPGAVAAGADPSKAGFFYVVAGAFSRKYDIVVQTSVGTISATYTTPSGTGAGDAALATPEYICTQLQAGLVAAGLSVAGISALYRTTAYLFVQGSSGTSNVTVNTSTGSAFIISSRARYTNVVGNLPAQLPVEADGFIMSTGDTRTPQYYKYVNADLAWLECGVYGSTTSIEDMPVGITYTGSVWGFNVASFEGRLAGDTESNPDFNFLTTGITGIASYQGRLVLLAGSRVCMSASNKPRRFYRSTVTSLLDSDPIEVGSSANSSASYEYAVPFQKDLILFSASYQALVPTGNTAITPRTASVVLTSSHETDTSAPPVTLGRTLMYPSPKSKDFFGVLEMTPSTFTDSQYISEDATPHIPKYMGGRCRFGVSSSVANMAVFAPTGDLYSLIVHEYTWDADKKVQSAWHRWTFEYELASVYFASELVYLLFVKNGVIVAATIDPRAGVLTFEAERRPFLDLHSTATIVANVITPPAWLLAFDPDAIDNLAVAAVTGDLAGDEVGFERVGDTLVTVRSWDAGMVSLGFPYRSAISPTRPVIRDFNEVAINTNKQTLLRYLVGTKNSAQYMANVRDRNTEADYTDITVGTLSWSSSELELGRGKFASESVAVVPCRTNVESTTVEFSTSGTGELNLTSLEYVMKYNQKIRRR